MTRTERVRDASCAACGHPTTEHVVDVKGYAMDLCGPCATSLGFGRVEIQ